MAEATKVEAPVGGTAPETPPPAAAVVPPEGTAPPSGDAPPKAPAATPDPTDPPKDEVPKPEDAPKGPERNPDGTFKAKIDYSSVTLPKDADPALLERTVAIARDRGLSPEAAQDFANLVTSEIATTREKVAADLMTAHAPGGAEWTKRLDGWKAETLADESLGKTAEERKAAIDRGAGVLRKYAEAHPDDKADVDAFLVDSGLGEHPAMVRFLNWLGKSAGEKPLVHGGNITPGRNAVEQKYIESGMNP